MSTGTWTHAYPIALDEARELGLAVNTNLPDQVLERMTLYPQPVHTQAGGVEYLTIAWQKQTSA